MLTKDFSGVYDYEREQAQSELSYFSEVLLPECDTPEKIQAELLYYANYWRKCLCSQGYADFRDEWNKALPNYPLPE